MSRTYDAKEMIMLTANHSNVALVSYITTFPSWARESM